MRQAIWVFSWAFFSTILCSAASKPGQMYGYRPSFYTAINRLHFILQWKMIKISQVSRLRHLGRWRVFHVRIQSPTRFVKAGAAEELQHVK